MVGEEEEAVFSSEDFPAPNEPNIVPLPAVSVELEVICSDDLEDPGDVLEEPKVELLTDLSSPELESTPSEAGVDLVELCPKDVLTPEDPSGKSKSLAGAFMNGLLVTEGPNMEGFSLNLAVTAFCSMERLPPKAAVEPPKRRLGARALELTAFAPKVEDGAVPNPPNLAGARTGRGSCEESSVFPELVGLNGFEELLTPEVSELVVELEGADAPLLLLIPLFSEEEVKLLSLF